MNEDIDSLLTRLPEPAPPPTLLASVMARVEREPDRPTAATLASKGEMNDRQARGWTSAIIGVAVVTGEAGLTVYGRLTGTEPLYVFSSRIGPGQLGRMPVEAVHVLLLAAGLGLFLAGLFAPLTRRERYSAYRSRGSSR